MKVTLLPFLLVSCCRSAGICLMAALGWFGAATAMQAACLTPDTTRHEVVLETTEGNISVVLYNETPQHRDNFLRLVREGFYDGLLFHRVIPQFMIQAGDSASRHAAPGVALGDSPEPYTIPAEIRFPQYFHKRGALAAAREGDATNPERASSASQFYIVYGSDQWPEKLDIMQERLDSMTHQQVQLSREVRRAYEYYGGSPHLDGQYTVFGEVVQGMDVVDIIQWKECDERNRPLQDVRILRAWIKK